MKLNRKVIGKNVKAIRKQLGLSGEKFGQKIGISKSALSQIEAGSVAPSLELINNIIHVYGISFDNLMAESAEIDVKSSSRKTGNGEIDFKSISRIQARLETLESRMDALEK